MKRVLLACAACSSLIFTAFFIEDTIEDPKEAIFVTPQGALFKYPKTWHVKSDNNLVKLSGPEKDIFVYIISNEKRQKKADPIAVWLKIKPDFSYALLESTRLSKEWEWDTIESFQFEVPISAGLSYMAYAFSVKDKSYWLLIEAQNAAFSRRSSELAIIADSFRLDGMKAPNYADRKLKVLDDDRKKELLSFIHTTMSKLQIPGLAMAIINKKGEALFEGAFGVKQVDTKEPLKLETPFMIGSVTKALTTLLMARLVDENKISWSTKIRDLLKGFKTGSEEVTKQLDIKTSVSASMGMPRRDMEFIFEYRGFTSKDRIAELAFLIPTTKMGETFQYSNHLVLIGGYAAAAAYAPGKPLDLAYQRAMEELIFKPLDMVNSSVKIYEAGNLGAYPHVKDFRGKIVPLPLDREESLFSIAPAGAVSSTIKDLSHYLELELNKGIFRNVRLVSEASLLKRRKPGAKASDTLRYGLGLFIEDFKGIKIIGHDGNTLGFTASLSFLPELGVGVVMLANLQGVNSGLRAILLKFLELSLDLPNKSDEKIARFEQTSKKTQHLLQSRVNTDAAKAPWVKEWLGSYDNPRLGVIILRKAAHGGFEFDAGEWVSNIGTFVNNKGEKSLLLTSPPFFLEFRLDEKNRSMILDGQQEIYRFIKI